MAYVHEDTCLNTRLCSALAELAELVVEEEKKGVLRKLRPNTLYPKKQHALVDMQDIYTRHLGVQP